MGLSVPNNYVLVLLYLSFGCYAKIVPGANIVISSSADPFHTGQVAFYKELTIPTDSLSEIIIDFTGARSNSTDKIVFGILQAHSCYYNISLGYNRTIERGYHEIGTNLGLIVRNTSHPTSVFIHNNIYHVDVQISIAFVPYNRSAPVPGACSMEQPMPEEPSLVLNVNADMTTVDTPLASTAKGMCSSASKLGYTGYHRFLKKFDYSCNSYFANIRAMMTADQIRSNGQLGFAHPTKTNRRTYITVPGTGVVYATLVNDLQDGALATYVPVYSVACSPFLWDNKCDVFSNPLFHVLNLVLIVAGVIRAYFGSCLFCIGAAIDGFVVGAFVAFYIQSNWFSEYTLSTGEEISLLCVSGGVLAFVMFVFWFLCPFAEMFTQVMTNLIVGYILCSFTITVFQTADWRSGGFWYETLFLVMTLILIVLLPPWWNPSGILLSVAWGSFAIMQAVFFFRGSHSSYWLLNSFNTFRNKEFR